MRRTNGRYGRHYNRRKPKGFKEFSRLRLTKRFYVIAGCVAAALVLLLVAGIWGWNVVEGRVAAAAAQDTLYQGITIDGVELSGMTRAEAIAALNEANAGRLQEVSVQLNYEGETVATLCAADIGASLDIEKQVDLAFEQGREGSTLEKYQALRSIARGGYKAETTLTYDEQVLDEAVAEAKERVDTPMQEASVDFRPDEDPVFLYREGTVGFEVNGEKLGKEIKERLQESFSVEIELEAEITEPTLTVEDLKAVTKLRASASTNLGSSTENRVHNVTRSIRAFNGKVVQPGGRLSFNDTTGDRSVENGYKEATEILADKSYGPGVGGGVCQSSTTMYNAVLKAGLDVLARNHHSIPVGYVPKGLDCAVAYGYMDLKFENTSDWPIYIQTFVSNNEVHVIIYGEPLPAGTEIKLTSEVLETIPAPEPKLVEDTEGEHVKYKDQTYVKIPSREGFKVRSTRQYWVNGELDREELLKEDYYQEIQGTTLVGVEEREPDPSPTPTPTPTPDPSAEPTAPPEEGEPTDDELE